jgi:hypothetical protein
MALSLNDPNRLTDSKWDAMTFNDSLSVALARARAFKDVGRSQDALDILTNVENTAPELSHLVARLRTRFDRLR